MFNERYTKSLALFERGSSVIPGGIYGHTSPAVSLPGASPYYASRAAGCRYWDVDDNEFIDFMCGYGPIVLGYCDPAVEAAADAARVMGDCFNHPGEVMVELAEYLTAKVDFADWCVFGKNGSDMTTWAVQVAREATGRPKILKAAGAYHGIDPWCTPGHGGLLPEDREHIHNFHWNDLESLERCFRAFPGQIAAVVLTPFHHPAFADCELPADGFWKGVESLCRAQGALLILDDIRCGFRLHAGGSHRSFGFEPDLICFCKAIANGYPLSACLGRGELKAAASRVFLTGSYWNGTTAMAAALACLRTMEATDAIARMERLGKRLWTGLVALGERFDEPIVASGVPAIPFFRFEREQNFLRWQQFCALVCARGAFFHPHHNWFMCAAHDESAIDSALEMAESAMQELQATVPAS